MVTTKISTVWICPYCDRSHDDYDDAVDCANDCVDVETPIDREEGNHFCDICGESYEKEKRAISCEDEHENKNDMIYRKWLEEQRIKELLEIGNHPNQTKLV